MRLEKIEIQKSTHSGSDWEVLRRDVRVWHGPDGELRMQVSLPTGKGNSFFTIFLPRAVAQKLGREIEDAFENHIGVLENRQKNLTAKIKKLEEAQSIEEIL